MRNLLILDFETYFDSEYSLRKMTTPAYILDPRFEMQLVAVKLNAGPHEIIDGPDFPAYLARLDASKTTTVTFNSLFDNSILAWRYGFVPNLMLDAMGMARAVLGHELYKFSLKSVADHLQLGSKGTALANMMGKRAAAIKSEGLWDEFCAYALQDNVLCEGIFLRLYPEFPRSEHRVMDLVLRCCIEPSFVCDVELLRSHLEQVKLDKAKLLNNCSIDQIKLMSAVKFQKALEDRGVTVKTKISRTTGKETPQFAKTDPFMAELSEHPDIEVQAMVAARLGLKSTIEETRAEKLLSIATLDWPGDTNMPVPLRYGGAHTQRLSGDWGMNMQNMPADRKKTGASKLRASLKPPEGHKVIVADLGQIEARLSAWFCGAQKLLAQFANKQDPYAILASEIFGRPIVRKIDFAEGFVGKTGILGLGYGCGKDKFHTMVVQGARAFDVDIAAVYSREIGDRAVDTYRRIHKEIPEMWSHLDAALKQSWLHGANKWVVGPGQVVSFGRGYVILPNGMKLYYGDPMEEEVTYERAARVPSFPNDVKVEGQPTTYTRTEYSYQYGRTRHKIYGAKLLENITQALARIVVMDAAVRLYRKGLRFVLQAHDELVFIIKHDDVDGAVELVHSEMIRPPSWAPDLPLTADVGVGDSYASAKN